MGDSIYSKKEVKSIIQDNPTYRFKSYTAVIILVLLGFCFLIMVGTLGPDVFGLAIFSVIIALPVIILFRHKFISFLPSVISDNLLEIDHDIEKRKQLKATIKFNVSKLAKEIAIYIIIVLLIIGGCLQLKSANDSLPEKKTIVKILGAFLCFTIGGIAILDLDTVNGTSETSVTSSTENKTS